MRMLISSIILNRNLRDSLTHIRSSEFYTLINIEKRVYIHFLELQRNSSSKHLQERCQNKNEKGNLSRNMNMFHEFSFNRLKTEINFNFSNHVGAQYSILIVLRIF
jgi:hypothetical protein